MATENVSPLELSRRIYLKCGKTRSYQTIWNYIRSGQIPAQQVNGRWEVPADDEDLDRIAEALRLKPRTTGRAA